MKICLLFVVAVVINIQLYEGFWGGHSRRRRRQISTARQGFWIGHSRRRRHQISTARPTLATSRQCVGNSVVYDQCNRRCKCVKRKMTSCYRVRKDFTSMTSADRARYIRVYKTASSLRPYKREFDRLIKLHRDLFATAIHQQTQFLPWHRWYLLQLENLLRKIDCKVTLPYWDWSLWSHNPWSRSHLWRDSEDGFGGNGVAPSYCVTTGPFSLNRWSVSPSARIKAGPKGRCLRRSFNGNPPDAAAVDLVMKIPANNFKQFEVGLRVNLHDTVHCRFATSEGIMCSSSSAAAPEFFLHHGLVDKWWSDWQKKSRAHKMAYFGSSRGRMVRSPVSAFQMLDLSNLGSGVRVVYDDPTHDGLRNVVKNMRKLSVARLQKIPRRPFSGLSKIAERIFAVGKRDDQLARQIQTKISPHVRASTATMNREERVLGFKLRFVK